MISRLNEKSLFIRGNSGIGKTTLVDYVGRSLVNPAVKLNCNAKCYVLSGADWRLSIESCSGYILFLDETAHFMTSAEFAKIIKSLIIILY